VISKLPGGGYDLNVARVAYIRHLRRERTRSGKPEAEAAFLEQKTVALEIRNRQRLNDLLPREAVEDVLDGYVGMVTTAILSIGARVAPTDIALRRKVDAAVHEVRKSIHARLADKLEEFRATGEFKAKVGAADDN
jgi:hypothetical protein